MTIRGDNLFAYTAVLRDRMMSMTKAEQRAFRAGWMSAADAASLVDAPSSVASRTLFDLGNALIPNKRLRDVEAERDSDA
jgi:hypothetical protein